MQGEIIDLVDAGGLIKELNVAKISASDYPHLYVQIVIGVIFDPVGRILVHRRSLQKRVNPGDIDHVCGGVLAGETPESALLRESLEETGLQPSNVKLIARGVNKYNRFRYLLIGESAEDPVPGDPAEVEWVKFYDVNELREKNRNGDFTFVDEFFEETELALGYKNNIGHKP